MSENGPSEEAEAQKTQPKHVLVLDDKKFVCADDIPLTWIIRHADKNWLEYSHQFLVKVVDPNELNDMWDAFEAADQEEALEAVNALIQSYSDAPPGKAKRSASGSKRTKRK